MRTAPIYVFLILAVGIGITSCSKSDPAPVLAGTWTIVNYSVTGCTNASDNLGLTDCEASGVSVIVFCETWVFTATTITITNGALSGALVVDYTLSGNTLTTSIAGSTLSTATYTKTDTTLTLSFPGGASLPGCTTVENFNKV